MKRFFFFVVLLFITSISIAQETPVKWAFKSVPLSDDEVELRFSATIQEHWHLFSQYHHSIELPTVFEFTPDAHYAMVGKVIEPTPVESYDPLFGDTSKYFERSVTFRQKIRIKEAGDFVVKGKISGQACIEGRCVAMEKKFRFELTGLPEKENTPAEEPTPDTTQQSSNITDTDAAATSSFAEIPNDTTEQDAPEDSLWRFFILAFLGGLVGLLTPCVFPMIPMTISYFMKSSKNGKFKAIFYGLSIIFIYVIFGVLLSLIFGAGFSNILSTHWLPNILFAVIFIIFAISLLGYFEITLPSSWTNGSAKMESRGGLLGVFFMALTLVLVSFSCTLPIAGAVALNAAGGSLLKPIIGMFGFSLAFALPFTFFAFFPNLLKSLPKSGGWMNSLKVVLAFVELAFALKFLNVPDQVYHWGILDREIYLAFWIVIFSLLGFYLLGKIRFPLDDEMPYQKSPFRFILALCTFTFVVYLIPGMFGAPLKAISGWLPPMTSQDFDVAAIVRTETQSATFTMDETPKYADRLELPFGIKGYFDYDQALQVAKRENKPVFIDFTGHGCVNCRNVENAVWSDPRIRKMFAEKFVVAALYVDDKNIRLAPEERLVDADGDTIHTLGGKNMFIENTLYKEVSQPCYFIISPDEKILAGPVYYELDVEKYLRFLELGVRSEK